MRIGQLQGRTAVGPEPTGGAQLPAWRTYGWPLWRSSNSPDAVKGAQTDHVSLRWGESTVDVIPSWFFTVVPRLYDDDAKRTSFARYQLRARKCNTIAVGKLHNFN